MAYFETINLVQGDTNPVLVFTLRDSKTAKDSSTLLDEDDSSTWKVIDITNYTIKLKFKAANSTTVLFTEQLSLVVPAEGTCQMVWPTGGLDVPAGVYEAELEVTDASTPARTQTVYDKLKFKVREQF